MPDVNSGASAEELEWARPNLRLFLGNERRDGYGVVRVAELIRQASGRAIIRDNHVPPVLHLEASAFLQSGLNRVLTVASSRQKDLAAERGQRVPGNVEFHATNAQTFWLLHTLNGVIPVLAHLMETPRAHPEELYLVLAGLVGQLRSQSSMTRLIRYSTELYASLEAETGLATGWKRCGSVSVARTQDRMVQLRRTISAARAQGVEIEELSPAQAG